MKILARQLNLDLYNCNSKRLTDIEGLKGVLHTALNGTAQLTSEFTDAEHFALVGAFSDGHIALHIYEKLRYVAVDIFTCAEESEPEELSKHVRKFFQPDKMNSTFLKRGDFGQERDMKPKIKTRVAPLRKVRNAGAKVVKKLVQGDGK